MRHFTSARAVGLVLFAIGGASASPGEAQPRALTLEDLYSPSAAVSFSGRPVSGLSWINDSEYSWPRPGGGGVDWLRVRAPTGDTTPLFDAGAMQAALARMPELSDAASRLSRSRGLTFNPDWTGALFAHDDDLYYYGFGTGRASRLTKTAGTEENPTFSPDGRRVAFTRDGNLFVVDVATAAERAVTSGGGTRLLNGRLDWVYEEELYGRGNTRGYWWSPDSSALAFLQLDETPVPDFTIVDHIPYRLDLQTWPYPKAGDANPTVRLGVVGAGGGAVTWMDPGQHATDLLIVNVAWHPGGRSVFFQVQNREQSWLELKAGDRTTGASRTVLREAGPAWVNCGNLGCQDDESNPIWLRDGTFLWPSERNGWRHLYLYDDGGRLIRQVTSGRWEARVVHGVDEARGWIYLSGTERSPIGRDVYRVKPDGSAFMRVSARAGTHTADFSPRFSFYLDRWSDARTPAQTRLHEADGREVRLVDENPVAALAEFRRAEPEFLQVPARDGFVMEALMIKPPDFDPGRKYPVYQWVYGGPHSQRVLDAWTSEHMFHQLLAQQGIIVWACDNRTASGKGAESAWPVFRRFGESELRDIEDCLAWLKSQPYVDGERIGIHGWSYGGFLTTYALTHSASFVMGIAGGTVGDWRDYDTIYTERFLQTPENNPEGYRASSPRFFADRLAGRLLLIHGTVDDNVHLQNTLQLAYELQRAGKAFDLMLYPRSRHSVTDPQLVYHMRSTMFRFILERLVLAPSSYRR